MGKTAFLRVFFALAASSAAFAQDGQALYGQISANVVYLRHEFTVDKSISKQAKLWQRFKDATETDILDKSYVYGSGSGFFIDDKGRIVTNRHVANMGSVEGMRGKLIEGLNEQIGKMALYYTEMERAQLKEDCKRLFKDAAYRFAAISGKKDLGAVKTLAVAEEKEPDLALVEAAGESGSLALADEGEISGTLVGTDAYSFGYPLGDRLDAMFKERVVTMNRGTVSALRATETLDIQHSAAISPGNSGGPLVDARGMVLGVNTASLDGSRGNSLFYAISVKKVREFLKAKGFGDLAVRTGESRATAPSAPPRGADSSGPRKNAAGEYEVPSMVLLSVPDGVRVGLNGKELGTGPKALMLSDPLNILQIDGAGLKAAYSLRLMPGAEGPIAFEPFTMKPVSTVSIVSDPPGVEVLANGTALGRTPLVAELKPGAYAVSYKLAGFIFSSDELKLGEGMDAKLETKGTRVYPVALKAIGSLDGAKLGFEGGGQAWAFDGVSSIELPAGEYELNVSGARGFEDVKIPVSVKDAAVDMDLSPFMRLAPLEIRGLVQGSRIWIDGKEAPEDATNPFRLPFGPHTVAVSMKGLRPLLSTGVDVQEDGSTFIVFEPKKGFDAKRNVFMRTGLWTGIAGGIVLGFSIGFGSDAVAVPSTGTYADYVAWKTTANIALSAGLGILGGAAVSEIVALVFNSSYLKEKRAFDESLAP
jgi:S1-C subfamily serine protease